MIRIDNAHQRLALIAGIQQICCVRIRHISGGIFAPSLIQRFKNATFTLSSHLEIELGADFHQQAVICVKGINYFRVPSL